MVVRTYEAKGAANYVGVNFDVLYQHHGNDPTANIHWIQVATGNHRPNGAHGVLVNTVDTIPNSPSPYYDQPNNAGGTANGTEFADRPWLPDGQKGHYFHFELYLVDEIAAKKARLWAGVNWGWTNGADHAAQN